MNRPTFQLRTSWNNHYETAWRFRADIIKNLYEDGERHPLRILRIYESIVRLSSNAPGHVDYEQDNSYAAHLHSNVRLINNSTNIDPPKHLPTGSPTGIRMSFMDDWIKFSPLFSTVFIPFLADFLRKNHFDAVVELGSGLGVNAVRLFYEGGPKVPYYVGEFSESGTDCAQFFSEICNDFTIVPFRYDHLCPDLSIVRENSRVFVFSIHSIEQVPEIQMNLFEEIVSVAEHVTCMHIEPFGWQLAHMAGNMSKVDVSQKEFFLKNGWNTNLFPMLSNANIQRVINLRYTGKNVFPSHDWLNPSSLAHWETP